MNATETQQYVVRYLEATGCRLIEQSPAHVHVQLSPAADKALTGRPYYWSFVERTGAEPETMSFIFVFDPDAYAAHARARKQQSDERNRDQPADADQSILSRFLGITAAPARREPVETISFGCSRLQQMFADASSRGKYVVLFEVNEPPSKSTAIPVEYTPWLVVNFKVELTCDMKRDEMHSLGICLADGEIIEGMHDLLLPRTFSPKIPAQSRLQRTISLEQAAIELENTLENKLIAYDYQWAEDAMQRYREEYMRIESYYGHLLQEAAAEARETILEQQAARMHEIDWQYRPRVHVSVINCGIFHLLRHPDSTKKFASG